MAGGTVSRTAHFVLHRAAPPAPTEESPGPASQRRQALFAVHEPSIGAVVPKRWAKRAVTRNGIKRQIYNVSAAFEQRLPPAAHVVRLRTDFARSMFASARPSEPGAYNPTVRETLDKASGPKPLLIGVTVLTSMEQGDLAGIGLDVAPAEQVLRLAALAERAGLDGLVCSAQEAGALKQAHPRLQLVTPGIRPAGSAEDDQRRILTPAQALGAGSDYLVIGRPISQAADPAQALRDILAQLN